MERLGLGAERCQLINERVIYARLTGWGQAGPYAQMAGHDINYVGLSGALLAMGERTAPPPVPLNLLGDYAGGSVFAVLGILAALMERTPSGQGQVVDSSILDGVTSLCTATIGMRDCGLWGERGRMSSTGHSPGTAPTVPPTANTSRSARSRTSSCGAARETGLGSGRMATPGNQERRPAERELECAFGTRTRDDWTRIFDGTDACVTPVLSFAEAFQKQAVARGCP